MDIFLQATAMVLLALIICLMLNRQDHDLAVILTIGASCIVLVVGGKFLEPVIQFVKQLQDLGKIDNGFLEILLKVVGIGFIAEIVGLICSDAGNAALGKVLQMLASFVMLWLTIPILNSLLDLISHILGEI